MNTVILVILGIIILGAGIVIGFILSSILSSAGNADKISEAYNCGFEYGKKVALGKPNENEDIESINNEEKDKIKLDICC